MRTNLLASTALALSGTGVLGLLSFPDCEKGPLAKNLVCDPTASPAARAAALVAAMTIEEKTANLVDNSTGAPRIGLPAYEWWNEALHGVAFSPGVSFASPGNDFAYATSFANPITMSGAFDDDLIQKVASVISTEARAFSNAGRAALDFWTPNINPYKDPRWGRGAETPGEDPFRIKGYVKHLLVGLEGTDPKTRKVIATCKHYAGYDMERWQGVLRYGFNAIISMQDLSEYYLPPFQQCARDSNVGSIMCSYNAINGTPACADPYIMNDILREHWGWTKDNNFITSDCNAVQDFFTNHPFTTDAAHAAGYAFTAGMDTICEVAGYNNGSNVTGAYQAGYLTEKVIDTALNRLYHGLVRAGYFDPASSSPYRSLGWSDVNTPAAQALALQSAVDGMVLKKNDGFLPADFKGKKVAMIGHWANETGQAMLGGYSGRPPFYHTPAYAAQQLGLQITTARGPINQSTSANDTWTADAMAAAEGADVILYFGGIDGSVAREDLDRYSIATPGAQLALMQKLSSLGKPMVVVQLGDQTDDSSILANKNVSAIVWTGFPGQDGGTAVFDVLTGKSAPAGRLTVTQYPADYVNQVSLLDMTLRPSATNPGRTFQWYNSSVLPFGHGLHYTTFKAGIESGCLPKAFSIADLKKNCKEAHPDLCHFSPIRMMLSNTGNTTSDYVALLFASGEYGPKPYPLKSLVGYTRVRGVKPKATAKATLPVTLGALARVDVNGNTVLYPGMYKLMLDVPARSEVKFEITGEPWVLDHFPQKKA